MSGIKWGQPKPPLANSTTQEPISIRRIWATESSLEPAHLPDEKFLIHRSALLAYKACPYKAYLEFWYNQHGLSPSRISQSLFVGICIHRGLQHLYEHCRVHHPSGDFDEKCIDDAVMYAHQVFSEILSKKELSLKTSWQNNTQYIEDLVYTVQELHAMVEALIRAYVASGRLREFLEEYEILEVEREEVFDDFSAIVTWLGKADAIVRRRSDNRIIIISIKTASEFTNKTMHDIRIDMQGCSEIVAVEDRLNKLYREYIELNKANNDLDGTKLLTYIRVYEEKVNSNLRKFFYECTTKKLEHIKVFGNQYEYLVKGKKRNSKDQPTIYQFASHLLHPLKTDQIATIGYSGLHFGSGGEYEWIIPTGKLPKGKKKIDIVKDIGVKEWIAKLARLEVQPEAGSPFQDVIIAGEERLIVRSDEELEEWKISTRFQAEEIAERLAHIYTKEQTSQVASLLPEYRIMIESEIKEKIYQYFPRDGRDAGICYSYYGDVCNFAAHCHEHLALEDGIESGKWITREPHHELEKQRFVEKGFLNE